MEKYLEEFIKTAEEYVRGIGNESLRAGIRYALFPGGKRLRPLLLLCTLSDLGLDFRLGLHPALGLEMIHTYSLIHDDLPAMDDDAMRRGKPSLHKAYGEAMAILVGDALLSDAFLEFTKTPVSAEKKTRLIVLAAEAAGSQGMVEGQVLDIIGSSRDVESLHRMNLGKTVALFRLASAGAGIIAGAEEDLIRDLEELSLWFGLAFQIKDDISDFGTENKKTYPVLLGMEESKKLLAEYKEKSLRTAGRILGNKEVYQLIERIL